ncbi:Transmembrane protease serine 12 [Coemansia sp. RSA 2599]|nr:Transmembrane protease serine 12 [Coemansia sp. RSA 2598]KAJ1820821.1 Transmembrane protease serine 12 [Coemansia sp. RSA 2599]
MLGCISKYVASHKAAVAAALLATLAIDNMYKVSGKVVFKKPVPRSSLAHAGRVIGGSDAHQGEFPFAAFLMVDEGDQTAFCGGTILSNQWILTAGHCIVDTASGGNSLNVSIPIISSKTTDSPKKHLFPPVHADKVGRSKQRKYSTIKPKNIVVGIGSIYNTQAAPYRVSKVYVHPDLNLNYFDNDIALIKLKKKLKFSDTVQPIKIDTEVPVDGLTVTGIGWGKTSVESQTTADTLQAVDLQLGNEDLCMRIRPEFTGNDGNYICVTTPEGRDTCSGDSGGPLLRRCNADPKLSGTTGTGPWIQMGITSYGDNAERTDDTVCAATNGAGFYTHAAVYLDYIAKTTGIKKDRLGATCSGNEIAGARSSNTAAIGLSANSRGLQLVAAAAALLTVL